MPFDGITTYRLVKECGACLTGGRVDKIYQPEADEIVLNIRSAGKLYHLLLSADPSHARFQLTEKKPETPLTPPAFCMVFRKHFSGNKILGLRQHHFDRILEIETEGLNEMGDLVTRRIMLEIMGKHSNLMLVDENGRILDSIRHVNPLMSSVRQVGPGLPYELPTHNHKSDPTVFIEAEEFDEKMAAAPGPVLTALYQTFNGLSPFAASEILARAARRAQVPEKERYEALSREAKTAVKEAMEALIAQVQAADGPCFLYRDAGGKMLDFSVVPYAVMNGVAAESFENLSALLDVFCARSDTVDKMRQKSQDLRHLVNTNLDRARRKDILQKKQLEDTKEREADRIRGDLITANVYQLKKGMTKAELPNYYEEDMPLMTIRLDENLTPAQNAQRYYARYNKQKRTEEALSVQIVQTEEEIVYLESILAAIALADCERDIEDIREELHEAGYLRKTQGKKKNLARSKPIAFVTSEGVHGLIGKNNIQNDQLTFKTALPQDEWFHVKDLPGSHVILQVASLEKGRDYTDQSLLEAAIQAALHSGGRGGSNVPVDHTKRVFVKKPAGSKPGFVRYTHPETIFVKASWIEEASKP